ncbi:protein DBF4 homolog B isoform X2 [Tupaia chinensis]|uniref:protein DBF4 homolog B isoform X2 n=1 Tax=Tupaia chinensis TaxID=246437 RepID=UPI000FFB3501|nr:protein DBF4 homolog B isoform X2 [Tupaia chinensis]
MPRTVVRGYDYLELKNSMAESRLRAPDPGARLGVPGCLGRCQKNLFGARQQPFSGKSFYLDLPAGKNLQFLTGAIQNLGGVIESFLSKEVSYIVSNRREAKAESGGISHRGCPSPGEVRVETSSMADPKHSQARLSQRHADSVPMSRGKELLQKAIRNQGSSSGGSSGSSSLLTSARSWGVRILHVDDMMVHVRQLSLGPLCVKKQESRKSEGTSPAAESRTQKVAKLKAPFLKIEDESRKPRDREPSLRSVTRAVSRRKKGYCECCQEAFDELRVHLESAQHQSFAREARSYAEVDRIIAQLNHSFADIPSHASSSRWAGSLASDRDLLSPETSPPSQPSLALGAPEQDGTEDSMKTPTEPEPAGTGECPSRLTSSPAAPWLQVSCQPTCRLPTSSPPQSLQKASVLLSPLCWPVGEPAVPGGSGPPSFSRCPAFLPPSSRPRPRPVLAENCSCKLPRSETLQLQTEGLQVQVPLGAAHLARGGHGRGRASGPAQKSQEPRQTVVLLGSTGLTAQWVFRQAKRVWLGAAVSCLSPLPTPAGRGSVAIGLDHKGWGSRSPGPTSCLPPQALLSVEPRVSRCSPPPPSLRSHKHVVCFPKCLVVGGCPLPQPPTLCTQISGTWETGGARAVALTVPAPALSCGQR